MMMTTKSGIEYRPIGDEFKLGGVTLKVEECVSVEVPCTGCFFGKLDICFRPTTKGKTGTCVKETRPDRKDIIFVEKGGETC